MTTWTERLPQELEGHNIASVNDGPCTYYAHFADGADHDAVAVEYASTASYDEFPVRLVVRDDWTGEALAYDMDSDRSVTLDLPMARTGGAHWQQV